MKRLVLPLALGLAVVLAAGFAAALSLSGRVLAAGPASFTDPAGDAGNAPDVTSVAVSDDSAGIISITVNAAGVHPFTSINVYFVSNPPGRDDYWTHYQRGKDRWSWSTSHWDGVAWRKITQSNSMNIVPGNDTVTWTFGWWDLGITSCFRLRVTTALRAATGTTVLASDRAPDTGSWLYQLTTGAPPTTSTQSTTTTAVTTTTETPEIRPLIGKPTLVPSRPIAGKRLTISYPVTRGSDGSPLMSGKLVCDPSVAGKLIPHSEQFRNGTARVALTVPKYAKGKLLRVKVTIKLGTTTTTKITSLRIR